MAGIDVGGMRKGFHAVLLADGQLADCLASPDPMTVAAWCAGLAVSLVGVDAPSRWRRRTLRAPERELRRAGFPCFTSPTRATALAHPAGWYDWMLNGERLYGALSAGWPLYAGERRPLRACFETFPHAVACLLAGARVPARDKARTRGALLASVGIDPQRLSGVDFIDAALCALAAERVAAGRFTALGDRRDGFILLPRTAARPGGALR